MKHLRLVLSLLVAVAVLAACTTKVSAQEEKKQKKKFNGVFGVIEKVDLNDDGVGTLTVKSTPFRFKKKDDDTKPPEPKTYKVKVTKDTKIVTAPKEKGGEPGDATAKDLKEGVRVFAAVAEGTEVTTETPVEATRVMILPMRKKKAD